MRRATSAPDIGVTNSFILCASARPSIAMVADPAFRAEAQRMKLLVTPMSGAEVARRIAELYATPAMSWRAPKPSSASDSLANRHGTMAPTVST